VRDEPETKVRHWQDLDAATVAERIESDATVNRSQMPVLFSPRETLLAASNINSRLIII
jgi:hypothetical protein